MKKVDRDFEIFKREFLKWQTKFGLIGWAVYFKYEPLDDSFADISINLEGMVATVRYNSKCQDKDKEFDDPKRSAKHEAIHLLVSRLEHNGRSRYITGAEMYEATEELVRKLEVLIP